MSQKFQNNPISKQSNPKIILQSSIEMKSHCNRWKDVPEYIEQEWHLGASVILLHQVALEFTRQKSYASRTWHWSTKHTSIHQFVNPSAIHNPLTILAQSIDQRAGEYRTRAAPPLSHDTCSPTLYRNLTVSGKTQQSQQRLEKDDQVSESPFLAVRFSSEVYTPSCVQHYTANPLPQQPDERQIQIIGGCSSIAKSTLNILHVCYPVTIQTQSVIPVQSHRNCSTNVPENIELGQHCGVIIERKLFISPKSKHRSSCLAHKNGQRSEKEWSITVTSQTPHDS